MFGKRVTQQSREIVLREMGRARCGSGDVAIVAFVTLEGTHKSSDRLKEELRAHVAKEIGALARPDEIRFSDALPKTRSGKIMRRLLREIATSGSVAGDVTTLEDFSVLEKLRAEEE